MGSCMKPGATSLCWSRGCSWWFCTLRFSGARERGGNCMPERTASRRLGLVLGLMTLLLGLQIAAAYRLSLNEQPPASPALGTMPREIGDWKLVGEQSMEPEVAAYLRPDDYIDWNYLSSGPAG